MSQEQLIRFEIRIQIEGIISVICALPPDTPFHATFQGVATLIEQLRGPVTQINFRHASGLSILQSDTPRFITLRQLDTILASPVHQFWGTTTGNKCIHYTYITRINQSNPDTRSQSWHTYTSRVYYTLLVNLHHYLFLHVHITCMLRTYIQSTHTVFIFTRTHYICITHTPEVDTV